MVTPINLSAAPFSESPALQLDRPLEAPEPAVPPLASVPRRVLVPLDGSDLAESVIPAFLDIARALDLRLVLLQVVPVLSPGSGRLHEEAAAYLRTAGARLADQAHVETRVRTGDAAAEIVEEARDGHADLIAMTTHGRSGLSRLLFGSVAETVLRRTTVPVFLKRVREPEAGRKAA
ncbi:MAG: universal stress protein [Candidatus Rokuibacteriota bacterium]